MKNRFIIPMFVVLIGVLTIGVSLETRSSFSTNAEGLSATEELKVETKIMFHDGEDLGSNIILPIFSGGNNPELLSEINNLLEKHALDVYMELAEISKDDFESSKKENIDFRKFELLIDYNIHTLNNELLSVTTLNYQYTGGAHGMSVKVPYNFDLSTGKEIILKDLFKSESNYKKVINEEIQKQIQDDPDKFFPDEVELFSGISENQAFYIKDGKLFIYFGQYDVAPYSSGIIDFEIPSSILKNVVSSSFIK